MLHDLLKIFVLYFIMMDPFVSVPVFLASVGKNNVKKAAGLAVFSAGVALVSFILFGPFILGFFRISLKSFQIAGGVLLFLMALKTIFHFEPRKKEKVDVAVSLIGVPLITGPGSLTLATILTPTYGLPLSLSGAVLSLLVTWFVLLNARKVNEFLGDRGVAIVSGVMSILLAAIGVEFILAGLAA